MSSYSGYGPRCPNHHVPLVSARDGIGICPISHVRFAYKADEDEGKKKEVIGLDGKIHKVNDWKVKEVG
jgi:uncharacterized Zn finger protein (UPF0148 family)